MTPPNTSSTSPIRIPGWSETAWARAGSLLANPENPPRSSPAPSPARMLSASSSLSAPANGRPVNARTLTWFFSADIASLAGMPARYRPVRKTPWLKISFGVDQCQPAGFATVTAKSNGSGMVS